MSNTKQPTNKNDKVQYLSPNQKALKRLLKNKPAVAGMIVIVLAVLVAVFGHVIAPDKTPMANDQVLEIATEPPGFNTMMLKKRKNRLMEKEGIVKLIVSGRENHYQLVPINNYQFDGQGHIILDKYTGSKGGSKEMDTISLADVVYPLSASPNIQLQGNNISFNPAEGARQQASISELEQQVKQKLLTKKSYVLGTDKFGRDNLSRLILGVRVSLSVGLMAVLISLLIGVTMGSIGGYFRGKIDDVVMWIINIFWSIPLLLLVFALILTLGREFWQIYLAVGLTMWVEIARVVRGQVMSIREKEYIEAAKSLGFGHVRVITKHILPNIVGPVVVLTAANFASAIIIEAGLSFLGIGVQPPNPSWGTMLNEYYAYVGTSKAFLAIVPGVAILILVLAFNLVGNGLRDALDVKTKM